MAVEASSLTSVRDKDTPASVGVRDDDIRNSMGFRLHWVQPDPNRERAVDPIGTSAQADVIADDLLPQLSSRTLRARYLSYLCWAVGKTAGAANQLEQIHHLEALLAVAEARRHTADPESPDAELQSCPGVIGRRSMQRYFAERDGKDPERPERLYKNTAFATYRPMMRSLGLITGARHWRLTPVGERLAKAAKEVTGRRPRCLSETNADERQIVLRLLGLSKRPSPRGGTAAGWRLETWQELESSLSDGLSPTAILERYRSLSTHPSRVACVLHKAWAWELLSTGLALAFAMLCAPKAKRGRVEQGLRAALENRASTMGLRTIEARDERAGPAVVGWLRRGIAAKPEHLGLNPDVCAVAQRLVIDRSPRAFVDALLARHRCAKAGEPWIVAAGDQFSILNPTRVNASQDAGPRDYRLGAWRQLLVDLGKVER